MIDFVNNIINRQLSFGYDVGKGYIIAEEEVIKLIDHMVVDKRIARDLKQRSEQNRLNVVRSLGNSMYCKRKGEVILAFYLDNLNNCLSVEEFRLLERDTNL